MSKQSVVLRQRKMPSGNVSLYLDIYQRGRRTYEYLHLYLCPERTRKDKEANRQTLQLAEAVCAKRLIEVLNGEYGFRQKSAVPLIEYMAGIARGKNSNTGRVWHSCMYHLRGYERRRITLGEITAAWLNGFSRYLDGKGLAPNTSTIYMGALKACINQAYREGIITNNPTAAVRGRGLQETNRMYLTADEVRRLAATPCGNDEVRRSFLFSCLTGLRHCDIGVLTWGDVHRQGDYTRIIYRQTKTHGQEYLDIPEQAVLLMGERMRDGDTVFNMPSVYVTTQVIKRWVAAAGINKHITFHCARHSFAVMMLELGTDIYTVSKLLGHRELSTTQIYAKVLDKNKQAAVAKIPDLLTPDEP